MKKCMKKNFSFFFVFFLCRNIFLGIIPAAFSRFVNRYFNFHVNYGIHVTIKIDFAPTKNIQFSKLYQHRIINKANQQ